eukprot:jgi/Botrbrau1/22624/Bobra.176_1s0052.1
MAVSEIGLVGLAVMGQNLALNIAEKGFPISVYNRTYEKTELAEQRAHKEGLGDKLKGFQDLKDFVASLKKPRRVIILVKAGAPVDATIKGLIEYMEPGDIIIDGGNEWYENTERRAKEVEAKGILYLGMGVSGGEEGARNGPSLMPGGSKEAFQAIEPIVSKVAAQVDDGPCNHVHWARGRRQLCQDGPQRHRVRRHAAHQRGVRCAENLGGFTNQELADAFTKWNQEELSSFLVEITSLIFAKKDDQGGDGYLLGLSSSTKTGMKGTGALHVLLQMIRFDDRLDLMKS